MSITSAFLNNKCASNLLQCSNWVRVQYPWRYPCWVIQERWGNTKRIIEVEQAILIYSNAQNIKKRKEKEEKGKENKKKKIKEKKKKKKRQRKKREKREEKMSKSISVNPLAVSTLSNARKAGEY